MRLGTGWLSREMWGAREPRHEPQQLVQRLQKGIAVHHSGSAREYRVDHRDCSAVVRAIQAYHMDARGWNDIAYNWLTCNHGTLFEGRGVLVRSASQGTPDGNATFHSVCWLGDGDRLESADLYAARGLLTARTLLRQVAPEAILVWPHLRFHSTTCPGHYLREWCRQFPD